MSVAAVYELVNSIGHYIVEDFDLPDLEESGGEIKDAADSFASAQPGSVGSKPILDKAIKNLAKLDNIWIEATTIRKREIIGSIFPEKLVFDGENFRTTRVNEAVGLIYRLDAVFRENKNGTSDIFIDLSHQVIPLGLEPRTHTLKVYCSTN